MPRHHVEPPDSPDLDTKTRFALRASISRRTVDNLIASRKIPYLRLSPRLLRIPWRDALDHLRRNYQVNPMGGEEKKP